MSELNNVLSSTASRGNIRGGYTRLTSDLARSVRSYRSDYRSSTNLIDNKGILK